MFSSLARTFSKHPPASQQECYRHRRLSQGYPILKQAVPEPALSSDSDGQSGKRLGEPITGSQTAARLARRWAWRWLRVWLPSTVTDFKPLSREQPQLQTRSSLLSVMGILTYGHLNTLAPLRARSTERPRRAPMRRGKSQVSWMDIPAYILTITLASRTTAPVAGPNLPALPKTDAELGCRRDIRLHTSDSLGARVMVWLAHVFVVTVSLGV
jgi:hypothetical protein